MNADDLLLDMNAHRWFRIFTLSALIAQVGCSGRDDTQLSDGSDKPGPDSQAAKEVVVTAIVPKRPLEVGVFDADQNGDVTRAEFLAFHQQRLRNQFMGLDDDGDGALSAAELAKTTSAQNSHLGPRGSAPKKGASTAPTGKSE